MRKILVLDMDGTIADFYGVEGWQHYLDDLQDATPYRIAKPMYNMDELNTVLSALQLYGWTIVINTWLSRVKTPKFHADIKKAKMEWLKKNDVKFDYIVMTEYGVDKQESVKNFGGFQVLVDDNPEVRKSWDGYTIDATKNILPQLRGLMSIEKAA